MDRSADSRKEAAIRRSLDTLDRDQRRRGHRRRLTQYALTLLVAAVLLLVVAFM